MSELPGVVGTFRELADGVPDVVQPLVVAAAGAVPFVEGELASVIGVWAGLPPVVAGLAAAAGNFLCVLVVVIFGERIRTLITARTSRPDSTPEPSPRRARFQRYLSRFGVPGASILGPLAMPTQFTSAVLVGMGVARPRILLWQGVAIVLWTTLTTAVATGAVTLLSR